MNSRRRGDDSSSKSDAESNSASAESEKSVDDGSSASSSDDESPYSSSSYSSSQHSHSSRDDFSDDSHGGDGSSDGSSTGSDRKKDAKAISPLIATSASSARFVEPAALTSTTSTTTNRTFHSGVLPISISTATTGGHRGETAINSNILTHRRGRENKALGLKPTPQCRRDDHVNETLLDDDDDSHDGRTRNNQHHRYRHDSIHRHHSRKRSSKRQHRKRNKRQQQQWRSVIQCCIEYACCCCYSCRCCLSQKRSTQILIASFILWLTAQFYYFFYYDLKNYFVANTKGLYDNYFSGPSLPTNARSNGGGDGRYIHDEYFYDYSNKHYFRDNLAENRKSPRDMARLRQEAEERLGSAAITEDDNFDVEGYLKDSGGKRKNENNHRVNNNNSNYRRKKSKDPGGSSQKEQLKPGCSPLEWHSYHFPNCNEVHEIDLRAVVRHPRSITTTTSEEGTDNASSSSASSSFPWGFVSNGLWRDVFSCDPRGEVTGRSRRSIESGISPMPPAVLKIMKREHPYDQRNFQRHRRDALVMERLSSSHHLVPIYGYCANTVLTQAISHTLDDVIYARESEMKKKWNPRIGYESKPPLETWMGKDENGELLATRETEIGRIRLALGVFRGLVDLHEGEGNTDMEWLPVLHADLQAKQYLVDADTGKIYLNDFNRCRFMAKKDSQNASAAAATTSNSTLAAIDANDTTPIQSCPVYIPTSPGYSRSPEEYNNAPLTEKIDIYSAGNILYGIITGKKPWNDERGRHVREGIQIGKQPEIDSAIRDAEGTIDAELVKLLDRVYEVDPVKRASAKEVVVALEQLLERVLKTDE